MKREETEYTPHDAYVLLEVAGDKSFRIRTKSGGIETIKPGVGLRMPLRQALDTMEMAPRSATLRIAGVVNQLESQGGVIEEYVPGATKDNDPKKRKDKLGFPIYEDLVYAPGTLS